MDPFRQRICEKLGLPLDATDERIFGNIDALKGDFAQKVAAMQRMPVGEVVDGGIKIGVQGNGILIDAGK